VTREISAAFAAWIVDDIPTDVLHLIGLPPTLPWESGELYFKMIASFAETLVPEDLISWMLIKDLADHRVEIARLRSLKAGFVKVACEDEIASKRSSSRNYADSRSSELKSLAAGRKRDPELAKCTPEELAERTKEIEDKLALDIAAAQAAGAQAIQYWVSATPSEDQCVELFTKWVFNVERIDVLLRAAEERFVATLREIVRHQQELAGLLRARRALTIDGELVDQKPVYSKSKILGPSASDPSRRRRRINRRSAITSTPQGISSAHSSTSPIARRKSSTAGDGGG